MKGASIGTLNVYIYTGNFSSMYLLWQRKGNKGNNWVLGQTPIKSTVTYQVKIMCPQRGFDIAVVVVVVVLVNQSIPKETSRSETGLRGDVFVVRISKPV